MRQAPRHAARRTGTIWRVSEPGRGADRDSRSAGEPLGQPGLGGPEEPRGVGVKVERSSVQESRVPASPPSQALWRRLCRQRAAWPQPAPPRARPRRRSTCRFPYSGRGAPVAAVWPTSSFREHRRSGTQTTRICTPPGVESDARHHEHAQCRALRDVRSGRGGGWVAEARSRGAVNTAPFHRKLACRRVVKHTRPHSPPREPASRSVLAR
jgi:hypothetical protein